MTKGFPLLSWKGEEKDRPRGDKVYPSLPCLKENFYLSLRCNGKRIEEAVFRCASEKKIRAS